MFRGAGSPSLPDHLIKDDYDAVLAAFPLKNGLPHNRNGIGADPHAPARALRTAAGPAAQWRRTWIP